MNKYHVGFLENGIVDLIDYLHEFHANSVDPRQIRVSIAFFEHIANEPALKMRPEVRHYLVCTQYTKENVRAHAQADPRPCFWRCHSSLRCARSPTT